MTKASTKPDPTPAPVRYPHPYTSGQMSQLARLPSAALGAVVRHSFRLGDRLVKPGEVLSADDIRGVHPRSMSALKATGAIDVLAVE